MTVMTPKLSECVAIIFYQQKYFFFIKYFFTDNSILTRALNKVPNLCTLS